MDPALTAALLFATGLVAGTLNVIAGGGSLLTLPVMIFLGLPPTTANGTNRVAILLQNVGAVWKFHGHRLIDRSWIPLAAVPGLLGAALGTWLALRIDEASFQRALAVIMVLVALWSMWRPLGGRAAGEAIEGLDRPGRRLGLAAAFFALGVYGGFIQAGIGFLILGLTTFVGLDLVRGNALKVLFVLVFTPLSLALFAWGGAVDWGYGLALGLGNLGGAFLGVRLTMLKGHVWIRRVVTVTVIAFAIRLWVWG
ncbi:MAG: sulfite exporter TauE/SafE family protein [Gemmatimonadota bacterium]|nr:sulfite exporter TauE/SafE family protein [Gemmatimonadota bacterium]